jgi:hypothetical protein
LRVSVTVETKDASLVAHMFNVPNESTSVEKWLAPNLVVRYDGSHDLRQSGTANSIVLVAEIGELSLVSVLSNWLCRALGNDFVSLTIGGEVVLSMEEDVTLALLAKLASPIELIT